MQGFGRKECNEKTRCGQEEGETKNKSGKKWILEKKGERTCC